MGWGNGNIRGGTRVIAVREAGGRVHIKSAEHTRVERGSKGIPSRVTRVTRREPIRMVGVKVAEEQGIMSREVEQGMKIRTVSRRA
jgi:hypothetical protein